MAAGPTTFNVAKYNLRLDAEDDGPDQWPHRREAVLALICYREFDHVGVGRDDGRDAGEHSAIFFRKARFGLLAHGDFNSTPEPDAAQTLAGRWRDARAVSRTPPYGPVGTFNGFKLDAPLADRIDYVFVSGQVDVHRYATLTERTNGRFPSDHLPVLARVSLR